MPFCSKSDFKSNCNVVNKRYITCLKAGEKVYDQLYIDHSCKLASTYNWSLNYEPLFCMILSFFMERGKTCSFCPESVLVIVFLHTFPWVFQLLSTHGIEAYRMEILKLQPSKRSEHRWVILRRRDQFICWSFKVCSKVSFRCSLMLV